MKKTWLVLALLVAGTLLSFAALAGPVGYPQQCTNSATNPTTAEWLTCTQARAGTSISNPLYTTPAGAAGSNTYVYNGTSWIQWRASTLADNVSTALVMPGTMTFLYGYDGTNWDRLTTGSGTIGTGTLRLTLATNDTLVTNSTTLVTNTGTIVTNTGTAATNTGTIVTNTGTIATNTGTTATNTGTTATNTGNAATSLATVDNAFVANAATVGTASVLLGGANVDGKQYNLITGEGVLGTGVLRVNLATDDDAVGHLNSIKTAAEIIDNSIGTPTTASPAGVTMMGFHDGTNAQRVAGEAWDGNMSSPTSSFNVNAYGVFYNGSAGSYWHGATLGDAMAAAPTAPYTLALNAFYNGTNNQRWTGLAAGADAVSNSTPAPWVANLNYVYNGSTWDRMNSIGTQADAQAASTNGLVTSSFLYGYNGATFDMLRVGASNELQVTDVATRPGEDAGNNWRNVSIVDIDPTTPAKTAATAVDSAGTDIVLTSTQVLGYSNFCVYVKNLGGGSGDAFDNVQFQTSPDNSSWTADLGWTACDTSASGVTCAYCVSGNGYNYVRAVASCAGGNDTTADGWITLNKG